jgi:hypothetical protein
MIKLYSKSYENILKIKQDFYNNNELNLKIAIKINNFLKKQKKRLDCKICKKKINSFFIKNFGIRYSLCSRCNHLNGEYEDTNKFANWLYYSQSGNNYSRNYLNDYNKRVKNIYIPKVDFLKKVIKKNFSLFDFGAGGGHFLKALEIKNIKAIGFEPNLSLCKLGNRFLKKNIIKNISFDESILQIKDIKKFDVISLIGVMEHLTDPISFLKIFKNSRFEYLYISVPLFSLTTFIENNFKNVFPRVLAGGHTHLFTKESLYFLANKFKLKIVGEWWFGTDIPDLYRSFLQSKNCIDKKIYNYNLEKYLFRIADSLQTVIDKHEICSSVHMIFKKNI